MKGTGGILKLLQPTHAQTATALRPQISKRKKKWVAHGVHPFKVAAPPGANTAHTNCEGARAYLENGQLWLEYASRGGRHQGQPVAPWVVRHPLDIKVCAAGKAGSAKGLGPQGSCGGCYARWQWRGMRLCMPVIRLNFTGHPQGHVHG